jgi:acyl-CoA thioesterase-1
MKKFLIILLSFVFSAAAVNSHATAAPGTATTTIMVFGDSLSAGYGLPQDAGWVSLLKKRLQSQSQAYLINNSVSGETAHGGRKRIEHALKTYRPDIVIVELGGNDGLRGASIEAIRNDLEAIIGPASKTKQLCCWLGCNCRPIMA